MKWLQAILLSLLLASALARAQTALPISGFCVNGAQPAITSGLPSSNFNQNLIPRCTVAVVLHGTTTPATIYADQNQTPLTNPFTAAGDASWTFYVAATAPGQTAQSYDATLSGGIPPNVYITPRTLVGLLPVGAGGGGGIPGGANQQVQFNNSGVFGGAPQATYNTATNILTAQLNAGNSIIQNRADFVDIDSDLHCDPTGVTECTAAYSLTGPMTLAITRPQGLPAAKYLFAATANQTLPSSVSLQFQNGAQFTTGNHGASTISTIQRTISYGGSYTISVSGCTSAVTTVGIEVFTNCPHTFRVDRLVILTGLTNVPNCYAGCNINVVGGNTFSVQNALATSTIPAASETGSAIYQDSGIQLFLATLGCISSSGGGIISFTSCPNNFAALPAPVLLYQTTNVAAGTYTLIPSSVTSTSFNLVCASCATIAPAAATGTASFIPGGLTYIHFSSPLAGLPAAGLYSMQGGTNAGAAQIICTGTTNYNGPNWITTIADSQDIGMYDWRGTQPQETAGSCYIPYTLRVLGSIIAQPFQQIVAHNSGVTFQGTNTSYVGWYGAQGAAVSTNDRLGIQETMFWNPGRRIFLPKIGTPSFGSDYAGVVDYNLTDSIMMYGNMQHLDGDISSALWEGGTTLNCEMTNGPCLVSGPEVSSVEVSNLAFYGAWCANYTTVPVPDSSQMMGRDAWDVGGGEPRGWNLATRCMYRDGVHFFSGGAGFNYLFGISEPDYWHLSNLLMNANQGYGVSASGSDANAGAIDGQNDLRSNVMGGVVNQAQIAPTLINIQGEGDSGSYGVGPAQSLATVTVSGTGYNAQCVGVTVAALPANFVAGQWLIVAGTNGSGGAANTDGTVRITASAAQSFTYTCPGGSGGPAITGTAQTADSYSVYRQIESLPNGLFNNGWAFTGTGVAQGAVAIGGYMEGTSGCPVGSGLLVGSPALQFVTGVSCNGGSAVKYGTFAGSGIAAGISGSLYEYATNLSVINYNFASGSMYLKLINGQTGAGNGINFTGFSFLSFCSVSTNNCDYNIGEVQGGGFRLGAGVTGENAYIFYVAPYAGGAGLNYTVLNPPSATGNLHFMDINLPSYTGIVDFFAANTGKTTIATTGITTPGIGTGKTTNSDFAGKLTLAAGTATFTFSPTHTNPPFCVATDSTAPNAVQTVTTATTLTLHGTGTDVITYTCVGSN